MKFMQIHPQYFESIPVFPLNNIHLFPGCVLSMHIFEPRYIDLLEYAMEHDNILAIADPQSVLDLHQPETYCKLKPYIPPVIGAGVIVEVRKTRQKTYNIVLQGIQRLDVLEECSYDQSFRQFATRLRNDDPVDSKELTFSNLQLRQFVTQLGRNASNFEEVTTDLLENYIHPSLFSHHLVTSLTNSKIVKKQIFMETNPLRRNQIIEREIARLATSFMDSSRSLVVH